jgi:hypothetical protein
MSDVVKWQPIDVSETTMMAWDHIHDQIVKQIGLLHGIDVERELLVREQLEAFIARLED